MTPPRWTMLLALTGCFSPSMTADDAGSESTTELPGEGGSMETPGATGEPVATTSAEIDSSDGPPSGAESTSDATSTGDRGSSGDTSSGGTAETTDSSTTAADTTKRVFVSSALLWSVEVDDADTLCQELADSATLGGEWVAWTSTSEMDAIDKLDPDGGPYVLLNDGATVVAIDNADLLDGELAQNIGLTELGMPTEGAINVWTGTSIDGTLSPHNCEDWTVPSNEASSTFGAASSTSNCWTDCGGQLICTGHVRVYCFER
jgi:hypothetical protein